MEIIFGSDDDALWNVHSSYFCYPIYCVFRSRSLI